MGQYIKGNNMAPKKIIMADMRMRKLLMLRIPHMRDCSRTCASLEQYLLRLGIELQ